MSCASYMAIAGTTRTVRHIPGLRQAAITNKPRWPNQDAKVQDRLGSRHRPFWTQRSGGRQYSARAAGRLIAPHAEAPIVFSALAIPSVDHATYKRKVPYQRFGRGLRDPSAPEASLRSRGPVQEAYSAFRATTTQWHGAVWRQNVLANPVSRSIWSRSPT